MGFPEPFYQWRPHPWHGLDAGPNPPELVTAYIEITPFDVVKYEVEKRTGYLKVDRPAYAVVEASMADYDEAFGG